MKWSNVKPKEAIKLIKEKTKPDHMYNVSMNKVKKTTTEEPPEWGKQLIMMVKDIKQDIVGIKQDIIRIEVKVDNNTRMIKTAHPELF